MGSGPSSGVNSVSAIRRTGKEDESTDTSSSTPTYSYNYGSGDGFYEENGNLGTRDTPTMRENNTYYY
jgi:hypothetical protein